MRIYTRRGDRGWTGLLRGGRVRKDHPRISALGAIDELNASLGVARWFVRSRRSAEILAEIQRDLFDIGAHLAGDAPRSDGRSVARLALRVKAFETEIDLRQGSMPRLASFVVPGECPGSAFLHLARAVSRRAERTVVSCAHGARVHPGILVYLNRLSDLLFLLARDECVSSRRVRRQARTRPERRSRLR